MNNLLRLKRWVDTLTWDEVGMLYCAVAYLVVIILAIFVTVCC